MAIAKTRIHMICGICGSNEMLSFKIHRDEKRDEEDEVIGDCVTISCNNCGSLTQLDEVIDERS
jgi:uncharacterized Zn finger protein